LENNFNLTYYLSASHFLIYMDSYVCSSMYIQIAIAKQNVGRTIKIGYKCWNWSRFYYY